MSSRISNVVCNFILKNTDVPEHTASIFKVKKLVRSMRQQTETFEIVTNILAVRNSDPEVNHNWSKD
jgi:hypothetical protein